MRLKDQLNKLEYFKIVVESGSFKKGAEKAFIGQPQLSKVIQQLEDTLGVRLLFRSVRGVVPTTEGQKLYEFALQIIEMANKSELKIKSGPSKLSGTIKIGTYDSIARYFFPEFLRYLESTFPDVHVFLKTGRSQKIIKDLRAKNLDMAVVVLPKANATGLVTKIIYADSFGLYKSPNLDENFKDKLIYFDYPANDISGAINKFKFKDSFNCDNLETVKSLTEHGLGVGLLPHKVAKEGAINKRLEPYHHPKIKINQFDEHNIMLCHHQSNQTLEKAFVLEELERFLSLWAGA